MLKACPFACMHTVSNVAGVTQGNHELVEGARHLVDSKAGLCRCRREAVAWQRRRHHVEGWLPICTCTKDFGYFSAESRSRRATLEIVFKSEMNHINPALTTMILTWCSSAYDIAITGLRHLKEAEFARSNVQMCHA